MTAFLTIQGRSSGGPYSRVTESAREYVHTEDNSWLAGDSVNDPNLPGAVVVAGISHLADADASIAELATLPLGHVASTKCQPAVSYQPPRMA